LKEHTLRFGTKAGWVGGKGRKRDHRQLEIERAEEAAEKGVELSETQEKMGRG
jgi:hypothetical protein